MVRQLRSGYVLDNSDSSSASETIPSDDESDQSDEEVQQTPQVIAVSPDRNVNASISRGNRSRRSPKSPHDPDFGASRHHLDVLFPQSISIASFSHRGESSRERSPSPQSDEEERARQRKRRRRRMANQQEEPASVSASSSGTSHGGESSQRNPGQGPSSRVFRFEELMQRIEREEVTLQDYFQVQRLQFQQGAQIMNDLMDVRGDLREFRDENRRETTTTRQILAAHEIKLTTIQADIRGLVGGGQAAPQQGQQRRVSYICIDGRHRYAFDLITQQLNGMKYSCPRCPRLFKSPEGLRIHIRRGNRTCVCNC